MAWHGMAWHGMAWHGNRVVKKSTELKRIQLYFALSCKFATTISRQKETIITFLFRVLV
jgi:hypothetical protein